MAKQKPNKKGKAKDEYSCVDEVVRSYTDWETYTEAHWRDAWERDWRLYHNERVKRAYKGVADVFVPMAFSSIETMVAALFNTRPTLEFQTDEPLPTEVDTQPLNALVDSYWDRDQWDVKLVDAGRQNFMQGTAPLFFYWDIDHPVMTNLGLEDAFVDPTLVSPMQLLRGEGYAGRRYFTTIDQLKEYEVVDSDPDSKTYGEMVPRYKNLEELETEQGTNAESTEGADTDRARKEMFLGSTIPNAPERQVEVLERWDADWVKVIGNRRVELERSENPFKAQHRRLLTARYLEEELQRIQEDPEQMMRFAEGQITAEELSQEATRRAENRANMEARGIIPFAFLRNYTDVSLFYGRSDIDPIADEQEMLNDLSSQNLDAITYQILPEAEADPRYASMLMKMGGRKPGNIYPWTPGSLKYVDPPEIPTNAFAERSNIKQDIRETTAIDQVYKGMGAAGDPTATEINAQMNQASQRIEIKARMLEKDGLFQVGTILLRMIQLYVTQPVSVIAQTSTGPQPMVFDPNVYLDYNWHPRVTLEIMAEAKKEKERAAAIEAYKILISDPTNNLQEIKRKLLPKMFDFELTDIEDMITPDPEQMMMQQGPIPGEPAPPPQLPPGGPQ